MFIESDEGFFYQYHITTIWCTERFYGGCKRQTQFSRQFKKEQDLPFFVRVFMVKNSDRIPSHYTPPFVLVIIRGIFHGFFQGFSKIVPRDSKSYRPYISISFQETLSRHCALRLCYEELFLNQLYYPTTVRVTVYNRGEFKMFRDCSFLSNSTFEGIHSQLTRASTLQIIKAKKMPTEEFEMMVFWASTYKLLSLL